MKIGFFGAGKMAEGILSAFPEDKRSSVIMAERDPVRARAMKRRFGVAVTSDPCAVAASAEVVFVAVRPQDLAELAAAVRPALRRRQTLVSIVAGKTLARLRTAFGASVGLVRVMPNLALRAGAGMCAICAAPRVSPAHVRLVRRLLDGAGRTIMLPERDFDAVTALSGSGPAYFALMEQAMAAGGVALGLKPDVARLLAEQTMFGTAKFLRESGAELEPFIAGVCTRGGTTEAGMKVFARSSFVSTVARALAAAARRSRELA